MSDKSTAATWSKSKKATPEPEILSEDIIIPNEDVFDLKDYVSDAVTKTPQPEPVSVQTPIPEPVPSFAASINPENTRRAQEEKYFYQSNKLQKPRDSSNWFIVTFLMTIIILGSLYFYFYLEDKNTKISILERQLSSKADNRIKGVLEVKDQSNDQNIADQPKTSLTLTNNTISSPNFSVMVNSTDLDLKADKTTVSIAYFNDQIGTKTTIIKNTTPNTKNIKDLVEIYAAEKQSDLDRATIIANILKTKTDFIQDQDNLKSKNGVIFTSLKPKDQNNNSRIYAGVSETFSYIIITTNDSKSDSNQTKINDFLNNILSTISFN